MEALERLVGIFGDEGRFSIRQDEEDCAAFPDGSHVVVCTNWAIYARRILGEGAEIHGFFEEDNPGSSIARRHGGHDFVVLDDRWIVDGWLPGVGEGRRCVFDLLDGRDMEVVRNLYGDRSCWKRGLSLEMAVDQESSEVRKRSMAGIDLDAIGSILHPTPVGSFSR